MVKISVITDQGRLATFDVDSDAPISNLKLLIEAELDIPVEDQELRSDGEKVKSSGGRTVRAAGLQDDCMLQVKVKSGRNSDRYSSGSTRRSSGRLIGPWKKHSQRNAEARPVREGGKNLSSNMYDASQGSLMDAKQQLAIEEAIHRQNIERNLAAALEHNPESFGSVYMLYVNAKVNGSPVKVFVDSGAQTTIMSRGCAERCGIYRLLDKRFQGIARGIGTARILGRVHMALLTLGTEVLQCSFTVMDDPGVEMLLGLDMLRKHQANIDLKSNVLRVHDAKIPFLAERDIPRFDSEPVFGGNPSKAISPTDARRASSASSKSMNGHGASSSRDSEKYSKAAVKRLTQLGFSETEVIRALEMCSGNEDFAANYLAQSKYGF